MRNIRKTIEKGVLMKQQSKFETEKEKVKMKWN